MKKITAIILCLLVLLCVISTSLAASAVDVQGLWVYEPQSSSFYYTLISINDNGTAVVSRFSISGGFGETTSGKIFDDPEIENRVIFVFQNSYTQQTELGYLYFDKSTNTLQYSDMDFRKIESK